MSASPGERRLQARAAAYTRWAHTTDRTAATAAAREGLLRKFENQIDPDGLLTPAERRAGAIRARAAYYASLAAKSAAARRRRKGAA
jgi:hypothetical protein